MPCNIFMFYEWDFFQHSAPEVISTAQFSVQFCSEIGLINDGISQKTEIPFWIKAGFDHCCWTGFGLRIAC